MDERTLAALRHFEVDELTDQKIYHYMGERVPGENGAILRRMAEDEGRHAHFWHSYTKAEAKASAWRVWLYIILFRVFGLTFVVNLREVGEDKAVVKYKALLEKIPETLSVIDDESRHEDELAAMRMSLRPCWTKRS